MKRSKSNKRKSKASFTLLEIMACLFLIALLGGVIGVEGASFVSYHRFRMGAQTFLVDLQKWRSLAMSLNVDVTCSIETKKGTSTVTWKPDTLTFFEGAKLHYVLPKVEKVLVKGKESSKFSFTVFSSGRVSLQEVLTLKGAGENKETSIDLTYPNALIKGGFSPGMKTTLEKASIPDF